MKEKHSRRKPSSVDSDATPEPRTPKFLAPALIHCSASALITASSSSTVSVVPRKQRAFRSFHICQETRANSESAPFLAGPCHRARMRLHHATTVCCADQHSHCSPTNKSAGSITQILLGVIDLLAMYPPQFSIPTAPRFSSNWSLQFLYEFSYAAVWTTMNAALVAGAGVEIVA